MSRTARHGAWLVALGTTLIAAAAATVESASVPAAAADRTWEVYDSLLQAYYPADAPGAAAIIVRDGEVQYRGAAGMAHLELQVPMRPEMVFNVASITKQFTAVAILMLADEGRLALSDPLTRFFPDYPVGSRTITVEHLLAHTSGLRNYTSIPAWAPTVRQDVSLEELIAVFRDQPSQFDPGERWQYNNSGYVLLGAIIEQLSGKSYGEFLQSRIFAPLGMNATHFELGARLVPQRTAGYSLTPQGWVNAEKVSLTTGHAAGALLSSVDDLARWDAAIRRGDLLSPASWQRAFTSFELNDGSQTSFGAGWQIGRIGELETAEHGGDMPGYHAFAIRVPRENLYIAILTNSNPTPRRSQQLVLDLASRVLGVPLEAPEMTVAVELLEQYVGVYRIAPGDERVIRLEGDRLVSQRGAGPVVHLYPIAPDLFALSGSAGTTLRFVREGEVIVAAELRPRAGITSTARRHD